MLELIIFRDGGVPSLQGSHGSGKGGKGSGAGGRDSRDGPYSAPRAESSAEASGHPPSVWNLLGSQTPDTTSAPTPAAVHIGTDDEDDFASAGEMGMATGVTLEIV